MNLLPILGLGALSGLRSMTALAFLSDQASKDSYDGSLLQILLKQPQTALLLKMMAVGEMVMDKTPFVPSRLQAIPLVGRAVCGGFVGAAISKKQPLQGACVGALAAIAGSYGAYYARKTLHDEVNIPDPLLGVVEDTIVVFASRALIPATKR